MIDSVSDTAGAAADLKKARRQKPARTDARSTVDRLPPHSLEAEMGVLGCCLISPNDCVPECIKTFKTEEQAAFYDLRHQTIYSVLSEMSNAR